MKLSRKDWNKYVTRLSAINKTAGKRMQAWIDAHGTDDVEALVTYAHALTTAYGEASSAIACEMYDEIAAVQKAHVPPAAPKQPQHIKYVDKAIRSTLRRAPSTVPDTVSEMVKRTGAETTLKNAKRDGAYFAWVPNGDTCAFCITLASNGWRRASKKTINGDHAEHVHKNCDCEFAISFNGPGSIEGYDPGKYLEQYNKAQGDTWKDKVNSLRRDHYAANKDAINAQKRAAYEARKRKSQLLLEAESPFKNPKTPLEINKYNQSKHIRGGAKYIEYMKTHEYEPSLLTISEERIQDLVEKYHGTGILQLDRNGNIISSEMIVDNDEVIGYAVNNINGKSVKTSGFKIHYSKDGTHIVPMYENQKQYWKERRENNGHDWLLRQKS